MNFTNTYRWQEGWKYIHPCMQVTKAVGTINHADEQNNIILVISVYTVQTIRTIRGWRFFKNARALLQEVCIITQF